MVKPGGLYWEEFELGKRYPTSSRTISDDDLTQFCKLVGYDVPLFVDEAKAKEGNYGGRICPSHLIMSFATAMTGRLFSGTVLALLAIERGQFLVPVRPGDTIRTEVEVVEKKETTNPERGIIVFRDHVFNQSNVTVFRVEKITLIRRQHA
jgi:3-hydroxybutyryl-CoA dehydratase